jgi:L-histidine Nalpha-methyltransferase
MSGRTRPRADEDVTADFGASVLSGLGRPQKRLEAKYLYDEEGSRLFDRICELEDYYPTRMEARILGEHAHRLSEILPAGAALVELGSGSSTKTRLLLDVLPEISAYVPLDISQEHLHAAAARIAADYPALRVQPVVADFTGRLALSPALDAMPKVLFFPGSTIGNFTVPEAQALLTRLRRLRNVVGLVVGADLRKDVGRLVRAYDDREGVTAVFNKNLLVRINRELDGGFELGGFGHEARWNPSQSRIEMHLVSLRPQTVRVAGHTFDFAAGETIHTENSHKFSVDGFRALARDAGWTSHDVWTDPASLFSVHVLTPTRHARA